MINACVVERSAASWGQPEGGGSAGPPREANGGRQAAPTNSIANLWLVIEASRNEAFTVCDAGLSQGLGMVESPLPTRRPG